MGLKKNNPGCDCCDPGPCLNEDPTLYTGVEVTGLPSWSVTLGSATATIPDYNATYLWAAARTQTGCFTRPPANWRLGSFIATDTYCCNVGWTVTGSVESADTGFGFPCRTGSPGFTTPGDVNGILFWQPTLEINLSIGTTSIGANITQQLVIWIVQEVPADSNVTSSPSGARWILSSAVSGQTGGGRFGRSSLDSTGDVSQENYGFIDDGFSDARLAGSSSNSGGLVTPISLTNSSNAIRPTYTYFTRQPVSGASEVLNQTTNTIPATDTTTLTVV